MKRGDLVTVSTVATQGDFGKPRPALVIQSDLFSEHTSVTILPLTSTLLNAPLLCITLHPDEKNHLQKISQVMIDKAVTVTKNKVGSVFGHLNIHVMVEIERCLALFLGLK